METSLRDQLDFKNPMRFEVWRNGKLVQSTMAYNAITTEGLHYLLEAGFRAGSAVSTWYLGLIDNANYSALNNTDTAAQINGTNAWDEFDDYSGSNRLGWSPGAAASRAIVNGTTVDFTINATGSVKGGFITTAQTKNATTGTLFSNAVLSTPLSVTSGDVIKVTYSISG